jgi:hypothetical protein
MASQKNKDIQTVLNRYQIASSLNLSESVKTHSLKTLWRDQALLKKALLSTDPDLVPFLKKTLQRIKKAIQERNETGRALMESLLQIPPEIFTLHQSLDKLLQQWNLLEDIQTSCESDPEAQKRLTQALANLFEALNMKLQLDFLNTPPELIAFKYSETQLQDYKLLLKRILSTVETTSDLYKIYQMVLSNLHQGIILFQKKVKPIKTLYALLEGVPEQTLIHDIQQYPTKKLEDYKTLLKTILESLETLQIKNSHLEAFKEQCQTLLIRILTPLKIRKAYLVQAIRVLRLCDHIMLIDEKSIAKNLARTLINCRGLLRQTYGFFKKHPYHMDEAVDLEVIQRAEEKVIQSLKLRGGTIQAICRDLEGLSINQLVQFPPAILKNTSDLLKETESLLSEYIGLRMPVAQSVERVLELVQRNAEKVEKAINLKKISVPPSNPSKSYPSLPPIYEIARYPTEQLYKGRLAHLVFDSIAVMEQVVKDLPVQISVIKPLETRIEELEEYIYFLSQEYAEEEINQENEREVQKMTEARG